MTTVMTLLVVLLSAELLTIIRRRHCREHLAQSVLSGAFLTNRLEADQLATEALRWAR